MEWAQFLPQRNPALTSPVSGRYLSQDLFGGTTVLAFRILVVD